MRSLSQWVSLGVSHKVTGEGGGDNFTLRFNSALVRFVVELQTKPLYIYVAML